MLLDPCVYRYKINSAVIRFLSVSSDFSDILHILLTQLILFSIGSIMSQI